MSILEAFAFITIISALIYLATEIFNFFNEYKEKKFALNHKKFWPYILALLLIIALYTFGYITKKTIYLGLAVGALFVSMWLVIILIVKFFLWIKELNFYNFKSITSITNTGFQLSNGKKVKQFLWSDFDTVVIANKKLGIKLSGREKLKIDSDYSGFYYFLRKIPGYYKDLDYKQIEDFYSNLVTCPVCGLIAVSNSICLYCNTSEWNPESDKEYPTYKDYLKSNQLEIFATWEKDEAFCEFKLNDHSFDTDANWKPLVTKKEVLDYSKKECW